MPCHIKCLISRCFKIHRCCIICLQLTVIMSLFRATCQNENHENLDYYRTCTHAMAMVSNNIFIYWVLLSKSGWLLTRATRFMTQNATEPSILLCQLRFPGELWRHWLYRKTILSSFRSRSHLINYLTSACHSLLHFITIVETIHNSRKPSELQWRHLLGHFWSKVWSSVLLLLVVTLIVKASTVLDQRCHFAHTWVCLWWAHLQKLSF